MWFDVELNREYDNETMLIMIHHYIANEEDFDVSVEEMLDEMYPVVTIAGSRFSPSEIMKELDPYGFDELVDEERERLFSEIEYQFSHYCIALGQTLFDFLDGMIPEDFGNCFVWKEE